MQSSDIGVAVVLQEFYKMGPLHSGDIFSTKLFCLILDILAPSQTLVQMRMSIEG